MTADGEQEPNADTLLAGRYRIGELIGSGGMGSVRRATDELLHRQVAIKRVRLRHQSPADAALTRERTLREARIAAALHHPHIVTVFDVLIEHGEPWLIMEYLPSSNLGSLLDHVGAGALPPAQVAAIGAQIADALAVAHRAGTVHRDVKPDNILIAHAPGDRDARGRRTPTVKLTDFGISHAATAPVLTATGILTGTPAYFAPETARGEGTDASSDVYSLGATIYAATEGHPPFGTNPGNVLALLGRIGRGSPPPPRRAGPLTGLLQQLLHDDPAARPTAAQAYDALKRIADEQPAPPMGHGDLTRPAQPLMAFTPREDPARPPAPSPARVRRWAVPAGIGLLVAAVVATTVAITTNQGSTQEPAVPAPTSTAAAPPTLPATVGSITVADPRTADPCSLLDPEALRQHGEPTIDRDNVVFFGCRADVGLPSGDSVSAFVEFSTQDDFGDYSGGTYQQIGQVTIARFSPTDTRCERTVTLSDRNIVYVYAEKYNEVETDLCAVAETSTVSAVNVLATPGIGTRVPLDVTTPLGRVDACGLLGPADLANVRSPATPATVGGFGGWRCRWKVDGRDRVVLDFYRRNPLTDDDGTPIEVRGRPDARASGASGQCLAQFHQGFYTGENGSDRVAVVRIFVYGAEPDTELCGYAMELLNAAAAKLPPPPS